MRGGKEEGQDPNQENKQYVNFQVDPKVDKNTYCRLCNMIFTSPVVAQSHYLGKIHAKKLKQLAADQTQPSTQSIQAEPGSSVAPALLPQSSVEKAAQEIEAEDPPSSSSTSLDLNDPEKYCKLCSAPFNNPLMAHQHYVGKKHKRNEARKKLIAEIGTKAIPVESKANVGVGNYVCPICSISLTSIEMYQSHMQGNKHQIKETMIVNLMKNTKKTYNSFQDELADYIKVQKARGLKPKTQFRKLDGEFHYKESEALNGHEEPFAFDQDNFSCYAYKPDQHSMFWSEMHTASHSVENRLSHWSPAHQDLLKQENAPMSQCSTERFSEKQVSQLATYKGDNCDTSSAESSDDCRPMSSDNSFASYRRSRKPPKMRRKEKECTGEKEENPHPKLARAKRQRGSEEETDSGKDGHKQKRRKGDTVERKSKHSKDKGNKESSFGKESRRHKKEKKKAEASGPTEEEVLWDESILGF